MEKIDLRLGKIIPIGYNPDEFTPEIEPTEKVRVILVDEYKNTIFQDIEGCKFYPGGKIDEIKDTSDVRALFRETYEEVSYDAAMKIALQAAAGRLIELCQISNYNSDYVSHRTGRGERFVHTTYYTAEDDVLNLSLIPPHPTENEKNNGLVNQIANLEIMPRLIEKHQTDNPRWEGFYKPEMLIATNACIKHYLQNR